MGQSETELLQAVQGILESESNSTITMRQLFYRLLTLPSTAAGHIPNTKRAYVNFVRLMTEARRKKDSRIDWGRVLEPNERSACRIVDSISEERTRT